MSSPLEPELARRQRRRRVAFVIVGLLLAVIFLGGYLVGILRNL